MHSVISLSLSFCVMLDQMEVEPHHTQNASALTAKLTLISMNHNFKYFINISSGGNQCAYLANIGIQFSKTVAEFIHILYFVIK